MEGGGNPEGLHGSEGGFISWGVQDGRKELVNFGLFCVEKPLRTRVLIGLGN
jgi:hypothetical protein